jgi:integrase
VQVAHQQGLRALPEAPALGLAQVAVEKGCGAPEEREGAFGHLAVLLRRQLRALRQDQPILASDDPGRAPWHGSSHPVHKLALDAARAEHSSPPRELSLSDACVLLVASRSVKRRGVPRIRIHDTRHTFASLALAVGVPVTEVSAMLGHANAAITMALYAHFIPGNERRPSDAVAAAVYGDQ